MTSENCCGESFVTESQSDIDYNQLHPNRKSDNTVLEKHREVEHQFRPNNIKTKSEKNAFLD